MHVETGQHRLQTQDLQSGVERLVFSSNHHQQEHLASNFIGCLWSTNGRDTNTSYASSKCGLMRLMHNLQGSNWSCREKCKDRDSTPLRFIVRWYVRPISSLVTWAKNRLFILFTAKISCLGGCVFIFLLCISSLTHNNKTESKNNFLSNKHGPWSCFMLCIIKEFLVVHNE